MSSTDDEIVKRILKGDELALEQLIRKYQKTVYNVCLRFLKNEQDAMDAAQDVFISIFRNIDTFMFKSQFSTWIYRLCVNVCLNQIKKQKRLFIVNTGEEQADGYNIIDTSNTSDSTYIGNPQAILEFKETRDLIEKELRNMGEQAGMIMKLRLFGQKKFSEIATILGIPDSTARTSFTRSRKRLKENFSTYNKEGE